MGKTIVTKEPIVTKENNTISVTITTKGSVELMESIQEHIGYIEENLHEQIINDIQIWMDKNYFHLIEFYTRATQHKLVPGDQVNLILIENDLLRNKLKKYEEKFGKLNIKEEPSNLIEPITKKLGIRKLKNIAKKLGLLVKKGMTKEEVFDLVNANSNKK
jgi:hypothetical protein